MLFFLAKRKPELVEYMDRNDCDLHKLKNTYRNFRLINRLLSGWKGIYKKEIKPLLEAQHGKTTLLDIGFGGGDIPLKLARWAETDGYNLRITAIETDKRAVDHVAGLSRPGNVEFRHCSTTDLIEEKQVYDIVISNHLIHHLKDTEIQKLLAECDQLASMKTLFNDIERNDIGFLLFSFFSIPFAFNSFIRTDGLISIRRSFTHPELCKNLPPGWQAERLFPFRLLVKKEKAHA